VPWGKFDLEIKIPIRTENQHIMVSQINIQLIPTNAFQMY